MMETFWVLGVPQQLVKKLTLEKSLTSKHRFLH